MTETLRQYINEWNEEQAREPQNSTEKHWHYRELYSIQNAVKTVYEEEKDNLTEAEKNEVEEILKAEIAYYL